MLNPHLSFENYEVTEGEEEAVSTLKLASLESTGAHFHLWGPRGCGKTHLLHALANDRVARGAGPVFFRTAEHFAAIQRASRSPETVVKMADFDGTGRSILWIVDGWDPIKPEGIQTVSEFLLRRRACLDTIFTSGHTANAAMRTASTKFIELTAASPSARLKSVYGRTGQKPS
jgi:DNA polymerase III delta prime subunit